ncbi:hypothetical protein ACFIJ5_07695 [Haloimpatiens sp. FM7330]|uniref:hypothetical protein n=1 Tax=Haloimpatiens sp. FM7330 TaxID=3298610 RepID=UPI0036388CD0
MESGIDSQGRKVHYKDALVGKRYFCPYCTEKLILRRGKKACFAHKVIKERTPLQRTCPEYHENTSYRKIDNAADIVYINNGGIPLYLCNDGNKFELRAYFPSISERCRSKLIENETEVFINKQKWCCVENLNYYIVYDIRKWIYVDIKPTTEFQEVKRKWLYGIRGIDIENDIYHANNEGGYRVAIKTNIYVGKKYRMMFSKDAPHVFGIMFKNIGKIRLKEAGEQKIFDIYEMKITRFTKKARQFIDGKGYHLVEKISNVIPLWPPAVCKGNELIFDNDKAWFYHSTKGNNEYFHEIQEGRIYRLIGNKIFKISNISICSEKVIVITNKLVHDQEIVGVAAEIKYILNYKKKLNDKKLLDSKIIIKDIEGQFIDYNQSNNPIPKDGRLFIQSNVPIIARVTKENYCVYSSTYSLDEISYGRAINIDCKGFGNIYYRYNKVYTNNEKINQVDWKAIFRKLYECRGTIVVPTYKNKILLYKIKNNLNKENRGVYEILYKWIRKGEVPVGAQSLLCEIEREIYND